MRYRPGLFQVPVQDFVVVSHQQPFARLYCRRAQLSGASEQKLHQFCVGGAICRQVEVQSFLAFGDVQITHTVENGECRRSLNGLLTRGLYDAVFDPTLLEKLPSAIAACSARAVITPVECLGHWLSVFARVR